MPSADTTQYCEACGSVVAPNTKFCKACGSRITHHAPAPVEEKPLAQPGPAAKKKHTLLIWCIVGIVVLAAALVLVWLFAYHAPCSAAKQWTRATLNCAYEQATEFTPPSDELLAMGQSTFGSIRVSMQAQRSFGEQYDCSLKVLKVHNVSDVQKADTIEWYQHFDLDVTAVRIVDIQLDFEGCVNDGTMLISVPVVKIGSQFYVDVRVGEADCNIQIDD